MQYDLKDLLNCSKRKLKEIIYNDEIQCEIKTRNSDFMLLEHMLIKYKLRDDFWSNFLVNAPCVSDDIVSYLIVNNICTEELAHLDLEDNWLIYLGSKYAEAFQTLFVRYYTSGTSVYRSNHCTTEEFKAFLNIIRGTELTHWLKDKHIESWIKTLIPDVPEKRPVILEYLTQ